MAGKETIKMIKAYFEEAPAPMFLAGFFKSRVENFHSSEKVSIDIQRDTEQLALVVKDCTGYNVNDNSIYSNKEFKPPVLAEKLQFEACQFIGRAPGDDPYADVEYKIKATTAVFNGMMKLQNKFRRTIELQASTILQTGICSLPGADGSIQYTLNYQPKASHFPVAGTAWGTGGATPLDDVAALARLNRTDGKKMSDILAFGASAWQAFINDPTVIAQLDNRKINTGEVLPTARAEDATFQGFIWIGNYKLEMWTYEGYYEDPANPGVLKPYIDDENVIVMSSKARLDASFGNIPFFKKPNQEAISFIPRVVRSTQSAMGMFLNAWFSPDGETLEAGIKSRPLLIPVAIDTFGCLDTGA